MYTDLHTGESVFNTISAKSMFATYWLLSQHQHTITFTITCSWLRVSDPCWWKSSRPESYSILIGFLPLLESQMLKLQNIKLQYMYNEANPTKMKISKKWWRMLKLQEAAPWNTNCLFLSARTFDHSSDAVIVNFIIPQQTKQKDIQLHYFLSIKPCTVGQIRLVPFIPLPHVVEGVSMTYKVFIPTSGHLDEVAKTCCAALFQCLW